MPPQSWDLSLGVPLFYAVQVVHPPAEDRLAMPGSMGVERDSQALHHRKFHQVSNPEMRFLNWHANACQSETMGFHAWIWWHAAARLKIFVIICGAFWGPFLRRLLCATGCDGRTFDTSWRGWFDQTGAEDAIVAWSKFINISSIPGANWKNTWQPELPLIGKLYVYIYI